MSEAKHDIKKRKPASTQFLDVKQSYNGFEAEGVSFGVVNNTADILYVHEIHFAVFKPASEYQIRSWIQSKFCHRITIFK